MTHANIKLKILFNMLINERISKMLKQVQMRI